MKTDTYEEAFSRFEITIDRNFFYEGPERFARKMKKATILKQSDITYSNGSSLVIDQIKSQEK